MVLSKRRIGCPLVIFFLTTMIGIVSAAAETVLLNRGQGQYGLGWLFQQQNGTCRVATPRHVIEADGKLIAADILDSYGHSHATFNPVPAATPGIDLAFLDVRGSLVEQGCSSSRLSAVGIKVALERMETATLAIATPFDHQTLQVERKAMSRDARGGLVVAIGPRPGAPALMQGMSGGAVMVDNRPVAMLIEVDTSSGTGIALRFDVIADELNKLSKSLSPVHRQNDMVEIEELTVVAGELATVDSGLGMFLSGQSDLVLAPESNRISILAKLNGFASVESIVFAATTPERGAGDLFVEVADGSAGFVPGRACKVSFSGEEQICSFSPRLINQIKISAPIISPMVQIHLISVNGVSKLEAK